jgi:hypothetical protein
MRVTFIPQSFCIKDPMAYFYLHISPYSYSKAYFPKNFLYLLHFLPYDNIILTPSIIFPVDSNAIFHFTLFTFKDLHFIEITNIPLIIGTIHIYHSKHTLFTLNLVSSFLIT